MAKLNTLIKLSATAIVFLAGDANARTWHINVFGTGDAPTIQAGIDSSAAGDTVLVGPGTYVISNKIAMIPGIVLTSESGPTETVIQPTNIFVIGMVGTRSDSELSGFWIKPVLQFTVIVDTGDSGVFISGNIIEAINDGIFAAGDCAVYNNLIIAPSSPSVAIRQLGGVVDLRNNIILGDVICGEIIGLCNNLVDSPPCIINGLGFGLDPEFCGPEDYFLNAASPCAPGNHPDGFNFCGLIGPLPVACGAVPTEEATWGAIKSLFSE